MVSDRAIRHVNCLQVEAADGFFDYPQLGVEVGYFAPPEGVIAPFGEIGLELEIANLAAAPVQEIDNAHRPQRFYKFERVVIEIPHHGVAFQYQ